MREDPTMERVSATDIHCNSKEKLWRMEKALAAPEAEEQIYTEDKLHNLSAPKLAKRSLDGMERGETPRGVTQCYRGGKVMGNLGGCRTGFRVG